MRLRSRRCLVTGASRGIGRAIAKALADEGARVVVTYREREDMAEAVAASLRAGGADSFAHPLTVECPESVGVIMATVEEMWGGLDVLVNNAGINRPTDFDEISESDWDEILGVNLKGPFLCTQAALPLMADGGSIINIGSVSGQYGGPRTAHYAASKAGLISLGQVVARFGASRGIRCNTVSAGFIASDMADAGLQSAAVADAAKGVLLGRLGTPEEVARAVVYLASDESSYVTGQTIGVNGGLYF